MKSFATNLLLHSLFYPAPTQEYNKTDELAFNRLFESAFHTSNGNINYDLEYPKYLFLQYIANTKPILFHGSNKKDINIFEPREQTLYTGEKTCAVFATQDPIWASFYAVLNKAKIRDNIRNGSITCNSISFHFYSLTKATLLSKPWVNGVIYLLPQNSFNKVNNRSIQFNEWISLKAVSPIAKIEVTPDDFYFINKIAIHTPDESIIKTWLFYKLRSHSKRNFENSYF